MKMPILKKKKLVCRDAIFLGLYVAHDFAWGRCWWKCRLSKRESGYAGTQFFPKNGGTIWQKMPIFKQYIWVWLAILYKHSQRCARGLHHLIEKWGGRFGEKCRFSNRTIELCWPFFMKKFRAWLETFALKLSYRKSQFLKRNQSRMVTEFHMGVIWTKMTISLCGN